MSLIPHRGERVFYRSEVVRWALILTGGYLAYALSPVGPTAWRETPSLRLLHHVVPWPVLSAGFVVYVLLLLWGRVSTGEWAAWLGLFMYLGELIALLVTVRAEHHNNPFGISGVFLACVLHFASARLATYQRAKEHR